jgi:sulfur carrier protein
MEVLLNGNQHIIDQNYNLENLINSLDLSGKFAIEINQNIIPRSEYPSTKIHSGDKIEIVEAIGGG